MAHHDPVMRPRAGHLTYLSGQDKAAIYDAALEILETVGQRVHHAEALGLLREAGCGVAEPDLVTVPRELVERARETAPAVVGVFDRDGRPAMSLGGYATYFGNGSAVTSVYDLETGERRPTVLADGVQAARLCDALPNIDFVMAYAHPSACDPHVALLESFRAMVANTTKPVVITAEGAADLRVMWEIGCALRGGAEELREKPYFALYGEPTSPLRHPADSVGKLLLCADHGIPAIYSPAPLAGGTAPITVAGHVAQGTAESLFGLVLHQLRRPGAPFVFGIGPAVLDMATMQSAYNAPEYLMGYVCAVEVARWLDLPNWGYAGTTDAQVIDAQAGLEAAELTFLSLATGSNLNHDIGYLDYGMTGSLELIVIADEYIAMNRRLFAGVEVTPETLAVDTIRAVGPGGDFLSARHTAKHIRSAQWRPTIVNRHGHQRWLDDGGLDLREQARRKALRRSRRTSPPPCPPSSPRASTRWWPGSSRRVDGRARARRRTRARPRRRAH